MTKRVSCVWLRVLAPGAALVILAGWIFTLVSAGQPSRQTEKVTSQAALELNQLWTARVPPGRENRWRTESLNPALLYTFSISVDAAALRADDRFTISLEGPGGLQLAKILHAGDPSFFVTFRARQAGPATILLKPQPAAGGQTLPIDRSSYSQSRGASANGSGPSLSVSLLLQRPELAAHEQIAFEAEPNDSWRDANPLVLGRTVYGSCDDIEYLDNQDEYKTGWDWFDIKFDQPEARLVYFELDLADRDIPLQLLFYRYNPATRLIEPYTRGKDPMEVLHDGQKVRYSKFISRVLTPGRYYLAVLGNHPFYRLRSTLYPVPPYENPQQAVETAMHYILGVGDAWFAQVPRLGSRYRRSVMLHDEGQRCTACHPTVFPLESTLTAFKNGYPIRAKSQFQYLMQRVYNAPTPLYGNPGVNWVRFVAIELQFFGKQGGLVVDYENSVVGRPTALLDRFTGFLRAAWDHRNTLPKDEDNGVSPLDSKFGFAWRDWRVLKEKARRTGDKSAQASADHIEKIFAGAESLRRVEGTQDRLHRLYGLALMNRHGYNAKIADEIRYQLDRQNEDGGWPDNEEKPAGGERRVQATESIEYLTGQTIHTLLTAGAGETQRERLEKGGRWLLSRQQEFGGWFQTDTIENFVTPMRETRYAIMALATLHPRQSEVKAGLGNRDDKPARPIRTDSVLHTLDDLDNLWQVPFASRKKFAAGIVPLLKHQNCFVRTLAAECLGRIGDEEAIKPLVAQLGDPVKMVWQSAAWALRQLGNRGLGVETIRAALNSSDASTRRGAARILAYQFYGMDERPELLDAFIRLLKDPDLLTRHQAVNTLSQWWYRTVDRQTRQRVFQAFIDRLSDAEKHPLQRFNISQGLYNLLDENLGSPGTGYGRWIDYLKPEQRKALRSEREWQEQEILLGPILTALKRGSAEQRMGLLLAFDGTPFWRGYTTAAFGPGNDRAFDFERKQDFEGLEEAFEAILGRGDQPEELSYGLRLAAFFDAFRGKHARRLVPLYLDTLFHPDIKVRQAAADVADKVSLDGIGPAEVDKLIQASRGTRFAGQPERSAPAAGLPDDGQLVALKLLRSHPMLLENPPLTDLVRRAAEDSRFASTALPLMAAPAFTEQEAIRALLKVWPRQLPVDSQEAETHRTLRERNALLSNQVLERNRREQTVQPPQAFLDSLELLEKRPALLDNPAVMLRLTGAARVDNGRVRQLVFELLARHPELISHAPLVLLSQTALMDVRTEVRRAAVKLASENADVLKFPEAHDYLLRLLVDPDARVRRGALDVVAQHKLIAREPRLAGRVKVLEMGENDEGARNRAAEVLRAAGLDPAKVQPTGSLSKPAAPDLDFFRTAVNAYFYKESARDGRACANCHATHRILRLAEPPAAGQQLSEEALQGNYRSLLKVIDVEQPEGSLVLRKPLSPSGQGEENRNSPTGLTHVGGPRWSGRDDPAYQTILQWIRRSVNQKE